MMLALAATMLAACSKDNNDNQNTVSAPLDQQIIGKWILTMFNGETIPTNGKVVYTFNSATEGTLSASMLNTTPSGATWTNHTPSRITIKGDTVIMIGTLNKTTSYQAELIVSSISSSQMQTKSNYTVYRNGDAIYETNGTSVWSKVAKDYSTDILGTWEGHVTNAEGSVFDDGEWHRWEYIGDENYVYYNQDADGNWTPQASDIATYFVDGTLLCTRWQNTGEEKDNREWWEIASIKDGVMNWAALRQKEDGSTYTATFQMTKVDK